MRGRGLGLWAAAAFGPWAAAAMLTPPYGAVIGWNAAGEAGVDGAWNPTLAPLGGTSEWAWTAASTVALQAVTSAARPGLTAAFALDGQDGAALADTDPQTMPLDPTDYSASFELWIRPARLNAGRQLILSLGGKTMGLSFTLDNDTLRFQGRDSDVRDGIDTNSPADGVDDDGLEDLAFSIKAPLASTAEFTHVVGTLELGGTNQQACLYLNGALATPVSDAETGLFKDETLMAVGTNFVQVPGTQGHNPVTVRAAAAGPVSAVIAPADWSGNGAGKLGRTTSDVGGTADPTASPVYLNDFKTRTFTGEVAAIHVYNRALGARQVAALYRQATLNTNWTSLPSATNLPALNYDAAAGVQTGGRDWPNLMPIDPATNAAGAQAASGALDWKFAVTNDSNIATNSGSAMPALAAAYVFASGSTGDNGRLVAVCSDGSTKDSFSEIMRGAVDSNSATFECWFRPTDLSGKEVLVESGGATDGFSLRLNGATLEFAVRNGNHADPSNQDALAGTVLAAGETADFAQAVGVIDLLSDRIRLYVNGLLRAEAFFGGDDWDGTDPSGLGGVAGVLGGAQGSGFGDFDGQIAILRVYRHAVGATEVLENYIHVSGANPGNLPPVDLALDPASIAENQPTGTAVGALSAEDVNPGDTHTFALVAGAGDDDNARFAVDGAALRAREVFDYETRKSLSVRVRATDAGGLWLERALTIAVDDLNEAPDGAWVKPNVIVYMCDDMGIGEVGAYLGKKLSPGAAPIAKTLVTPHFDRLAAMGTLFTDVHTGSSMCSPTRYALLTGRYAWRTYNKHTVIGGWNSRPMIGPGRPTLGTMLRGQGYRTAAFGKWHLGWTLLATNGQPVAYDSATAATWATVKLGAAGDGYVTNILDGPLHHGFDSFYGVSGNFANDSPGLIKAYIEDNAIQGIPTWDGAPPQAGMACSGPGVADWDQERMGEHYFNRAMDWIDAHAQAGRTEPFFFYYVPNANHGPTDPASNIVVQGRSIPIRGQSRYSDGSGGGNRTDMIHENDEGIGLFLDKLASVNDPRTGRPMIRSTMIVLTSDNGPDASGVGQAGLRDRKTALYEGGHRVPFIVSWPDGGIPTGGLSRANFGQLDLFASLSALLGHALGPDEAEDSANVLPALLCRVPGTTYRRPHSLVSHDDSLTSNDLADDAALAIREGEMAMLVDGKLVNRNRSNGASQGAAVPIKLFDLDRDLHQDTDLLGDPARQDLVSNLTERILGFANRGFSRAQGATNFGRLLLTDGGADLRNNRTGAIGYEFVAGAEPVTVYSLGLWDDGALDATNRETASQGDGQTAGAPDGLAVAHTVRLFDGATQTEIARVTVANSNSYLDGEFRFVDLPEPVLLAGGRAYALTMSTAANDGDLFHHFASFTGVTPLPSDLVGGFTARTAAADGAYPATYPDGADGAAYRHPDMFRHRMFVGPNARLAPFQLSRAEQHTGDLRLIWAAGTNMRFRVEAADELPATAWHRVREGVPGTNGYVATDVPLESLGPPQRFYRLVQEP